ncbi:large ribosomal subunit protein mL42 [Anopheles ziemanni]|uniref:large ribosomal subunit protein mL42 n=1 Tax=Anopheles coustani TaxID=139045 RepID=UPI00265A944F|nr:large ribosomal subunit protein mL42 [Anopheles coustani]XP_058178064.1 large ribosomal subunit protein mL42 [Anopheles ziemanni]
MAFVGRIFRRGNHFLTLKQYENVQVARANPQDLVEKVAVAEGGKVFVAWHPKPDFPYEFSKPIEVTVPEPNANLVRDDIIANSRAALKAKHPEFVRQELSKLTFTTKHRWFPRARDKRAKKTPMDREYL